MYFNKYPQPENFSFVKPSGLDAKAGTMAIKDRTFGFSFEDLGDDVYKLVVKGEAWPKQYSQAVLSEPEEAEQLGRATINAKDGLQIVKGNGKQLLGSREDRFFGVSGDAWIMQFDYEKSYRFYGLGEKMFGFEHSGRSTKFWNTDAWADFPYEAISEGTLDPYYISVPYLILKNGEDYCGILVNNPDAVFMHMNPNVIIANQNDADDILGTRFCVGSADGMPEVYFIQGPSLQELTQKLQKLVGVTPLPPVWSLGHQQCRWGYKSYKCLDNLEKNFTKYKIPNDGLWIDIDYMNEFRVFTFEKKLFKNPAKEIGKIQERNHPVVPIIDPGVKVDPNYDVYKDGCEKDVFCKNPEGENFVGFVWPGATVFPDFSMKKTREWWAAWVCKFAGDHGLIGAWLDMNDPSTGSSECHYMLFNDGKDSHATYHSQYALGMAQASKDGFMQANPELRPFLLSRSGFISTSRYAAVWTGDNASNRRYLRGAIPCSMNLSLSGIPFNGPDVPGFGFDTNTELAIDWYKTCFLFPFFRNHSSIGTLDQEPWTFKGKAKKVVKHFIQMRYKLMPYIYNLYIDQEELGDPIMRPLLYHFKDTKKLPLDRIDDQFMVGDSIMQAPCMDEDQKKREVKLPKGSWLNTINGRWVEGGKVVNAKKEDETTPLYVRDGAVIPMRGDKCETNETAFDDVELHIFMSKDQTKASSYIYKFDDGKTFAYQNGERTSVTFKVRQLRGTVKIDVVESDLSAGGLKVRPVLHAPGAKKVEFNGEELAIKETNVTFCGTKLKIRKAKAVKI
ncbi:hypothetical protein JD969_10410 [Planctomycetota bacterium]|nr:hypothetical protein JD969_10410 [Planctomycetota bacterium]